MKPIVAALMLFTASDVKMPDPKQIDCLAHVIYHEARGEISKGQAAVAHVVLNRTRDPNFPDTICRVIYQPHQFTNIRLTKPDKNSKAWEVAVNTAIFSVINKKDPTHGAKYFYAHNTVKPKWSYGKQKIVIIGNHTFL